ncbi:hypothetical protein [Paenibacillus solani]|uniref:hypothetical protein n=1 Tax=Paenibacillus solani TaxID=1705565 RepID=UPI000B000963|nr:hypothetical protein [Paenibacillus solani]
MPRLFKKFGTAVGKLPAFKEDAPANKLAAFNLPADARPGRLDMQIKIILTGAF